MRLKSAIFEFEMKVAGYQFPNLENEPYDSDWLNIYMTANHPRGAWNKTDACLLTFELAHLIEWLNSTADELPENSKVHFMEPELSFEWFGSGKNILRVYLDYGLRPQWSPYHGPNEEEELFMEFHVTPEETKGAASSLSRDLEKFPVRVGI